MSTLIELSDEIVMELSLIAKVLGCSSYEGIIGTLIDKEKDLKEKNENNSD